MSKLTKNQKQIIKDLTEQFSLINESNTPSKAFNLIDISAFNEEKRQGDLRMLEIMAQNEATLTLLHDHVKSIANDLNEDFKGTKLEAIATREEKEVRFKVTAGLSYYSQHEIHEINVRVIWNNRSETINNKRMDVLGEYVYEIAYWGRGIYSSLTDLVKSDEFKKYLNTIYLKSLNKK